MPIWPCELANLSVLSFLLMLLLGNFVVPIHSQATCAFLSADFAEFLVDDTPDEPEIVDNLSLCRPFHRPSVSCCTRQMETKFEQFAREQLQSAVGVEFGLIRNFFGDWSTTFRTEFSHALNRTERTLRHIFQRTYGHFFTQNIAMFDSFFANLRSLLCASPSAPPAASFDDAFRQLVHRIFLTEFALLNPLHSSASSSHEQCMLTFFPAFAPFGTLPDAIVALHGRTFAAWRSLIDALDIGGEVMDSLERSFALSSHCVHSVVRMRFCPICHGGAPHSPQFLRPCPAHCHSVLRRCLHNLTAISSQWDGLIDSLVRLSSSLASVHNPHLSLAPLPFQLSEAIMHFQENAKILSGRILFRCFGDYLQKIATNDEPMNLRRKRDLRTETEENLEEEEEEEEKEMEEEEEEEEEEGEKQQFENENGLSEDALPSATVSLPPLLLSIISLRRSIDHFVDRLRRMKGFWRGMGRMLCEEGGLQAAPAVLGSGGRCWDGMEGAVDGERSGEQPQQTGNFTREIMQLDAITKRVLLVNGLAIEAEKSGSTEGAESANSTEDNNNEMNPKEGGANNAVNYQQQEDYHSYESVGKWWQWTEVEKHRERNNRRGTAAEGIGRTTTVAIASILLAFVLAQ